MAKAILTLETLTCPSCLQKIENAVKGLKGIEQESLKVLFNSSKVKTNFDDTVISIDEIEKAIEDLGYPVTKAKVSA